MKSVRGVSLKIHLSHRNQCIFYLSEDTRVGGRPRRGFRNFFSKFPIIKADAKFREISHNHSTKPQIPPLHQCFQASAVSRPLLCQSPRGYNNSEGEVVPGSHRWRTPPPAPHFRLPHLRVGPGEGVNTPGVPPTAR